MIEEANEMTKKHREKKDDTEIEPKSTYKDTHIRRLAKREKAS